MQPEGGTKMAELHQEIYYDCYRVLTIVGIPETLADAASRVIATDDLSKFDLGRNDTDTQVVESVAEIYNLIKQQRLE